MYDLNGALRQWRAKLAQDAVYKNQDLDELESHLRDSVEELTLNGLSEEEAFLVAVHRMGDTRGLSGEFEKVNRNVRFARNAAWMIAGILFYLLADGLSNLAASSGLMAAAHGSRSGYVMGTVYLVFKLTVFVAMLALLYRMSLREGYLDGIVLRFRESRAWVKLLAALFFLLCGLCSCGDGMHLCMPWFTRLVEPMQAGEARLIMAYGDFYLQLLLLVLILIVTLRFAFTARRLDLHPMDLRETG